jgi:hypothetical protein
MPLVPKPFENLCISLQSVSFGLDPVARTFARFCPRLDIPEYREGLSKEKKTELDKRASRFAKRSIGNQLYKSSEFSWEMCTWRDVFGLIMDDEGLRMSVNLCLPRLVRSATPGTMMTETETAAGTRGHTNMWKRMAVGREP